LQCGLKKERCLIIRIEDTKYQNNPDYARHAIKDLNIKQMPRVASYTGFKTIENKSGLEKEYCNSF